jgi:glycosyltransferase involved in cell wall biosynthesis
MIVKNEAQTLAACLESLGNFASEMIIVDTGSTDRTVEIARSFGARVEYFPWISDFAAARNESLKYATGEWVFWLDADDRISPENLTRLKQALVSGESDIYACQIVSQTAQQEQARVTIPHLRLFRNGLGLRFEYPLHESLTLSGAGRPLTVADTNVQIEHVGYSLDEALFKAKTRRNLAIVRACLAKEPDSLHWRYYLGMSLSILGEYAEAIQALEAVLEEGDHPLNEVDRYHAYLTLAANFVKTHQPNRAEQALKRALARYTHSTHLLVTLGMFYLDQDRPREALPWLEKAGQIGPEAGSGLGYTWLAGTREEYLGQAQLLLANPAQAATIYRDMLAVRPAGSPTLTPSLRRRARTLLAERRYTELAELLQPLAFGDSEALRWLAEAEWQLRNWDRAFSYLAQAIGLSQAEPGDWASLAAAQILKTGQCHSARRLCQLALAQRPDDARAALLLELLDQPTQDIWSSLTGLIERILADDNRPTALASLQQIADLFNLPPAQLIRQHGRRLISQKAYQRAAEAFALLVDITPTDADAYKAFGVALHGLGHEAEAVAAWQVAQRLAVESHYESQA